MSDEFSLQDLLGSAGIPISRTPIKDTRPSIYNASTSSLLGNTNAPSSSSTSAGGSSSINIHGITKYGSSDMAQSKIEYLERERIELSLVIQQKDESLRSRKIKLESIESQLKQVEQSKVDISKAFDKSKVDCINLQNEKDVLMVDLQKLKGLYETQLQASDEMQGIWSKFTSVQREFKRADEEARDLKREKNELAHENSLLKTEIDVLKRKEKELIDMKENNALLLLKIDEISAENDTLKSTVAELDDEMSVLQKTLDDGKQLFISERVRNKKDIEELTSALKESQEAVKIAKDNAMRPIGDDDLMRGNISFSGEQQLVRMIEQLREKLNQSEGKRKTLHNKLQDLRGNIRVFVRCRPFLKYDHVEDTTSVDSSCIRCHKDGSSISLVGSCKGSGQMFAFDQIFNMETTQDSIYSEVSDLVQSALDGYKVCIFSYGQTGSGKTHTMSGDKNGPHRGIIPRSVEQIISQTLIMKDDGWSVTIYASMVELYNEELRDLLDTTKDSNTKLKISNITGHHVTVAGLTSVEISTASMSIGMRQLESLLEQANRTRTTACTGMNETSSRSHALFLLDIHAKHTDGTTTIQGGLRLVDLAGSERLDRTGTMNDSTRLKETVNINKSLSCLADVFLALSSKSQHVPFRNSKLTMLLQDCLSGDGKALMFVNVSPTQASAPETLCSLRFANQVTQVEMGKANRNIFIANIPPPPSATQQQPYKVTSSKSSKIVSNSNSNSNTCIVHINETNDENDINNAKPVVAAAISNVSKSTAGQKRMSMVSSSTAGGNNSSGLTARHVAVTTSSSGAVEVQELKKQKSDGGRWR